MKEAIEEARRAEALDPLSAEVAQTVGLLLYYDRNYDGATKQLQRALDLNPNLPRTHLTLSRIYEAQGAWKPAIASAERALSLAGGTEVVWRAHLTRLRALSGDEARARRELDELIALDRSGQAHLGPEYLAYIHAALGEDAQALALLERAVAERDQNVLWLKVDPDSISFAISRNSSSSSAASDSEIPFLTTRAAGHYTAGASRGPRGER